MRFDILNHVLFKVRFVTCIRERTGIGQEKEVVIRKLVLKNTLEQSIAEIANSRLSRSASSSSSSSSGSSASSDKEALGLADLRVSHLFFQHRLWFSVFNVCLLAVAVHETIVRIHAAGWDGNFGSERPILINKAQMDLSFRSGAEKYTGSGRSTTSSTGALLLRKC